MIYENQTIHYTEALHMTMSSVRKGYQSKPFKSVYKTDGLEAFAVNSHRAMACPEVQMFQGCAFKLMIIYIL